MQICHTLRVHVPSAGRHTMESDRIGSTHLTFSTIIRLHLLLLVRASSFAPIINNRHGSKFRPEWWIYLLNINLTRCNRHENDTFGKGENKIIFQLWKRSDADEARESIFSLLFVGFLYDLSHAECVEITRMFSLDTNCVPFAFELDFFSSPPRPIRI